MSLILKAARFADRAHQGQTRKFTSQPYIVHPDRVAARVAKLPYANEEMVAAAWLHDVIEDCGITPTVLSDYFPTEVVDMVVYLTNYRKDCGLSNRLRRIADLERIATAPLDVRIIKLCDRTDNVRDSLRAEIGFRRSYIVKAQTFLDRIRGTDSLLEEELAAAIDELRAVTPAQEAVAP